MSCAEPCTIILPRLTEGDKKDKVRKVSVNSTFISLRSHLATLSWPGINLLSGMRVTNFAAKAACVLSVGSAEIPKDTNSPTETYQSL